MLQRLSEDLEYHELLDKAAKCQSSLEQMCYVAAFSVSSYSTTVHRTGKPFNPLLGETFELDRRRESGYRSLCEQVRRPKGSWEETGSETNAVGGEGGWGVAGDYPADSAASVSFSRVLREREQALVSDVGRSSTWTQLGSWWRLLVASSSAPSLFIGFQPKYLKYAISTADKRRNDDVTHPRSE